MALKDQPETSLRVEDQPVFTPTPKSHKPDKIPALTWHRLGGYYGPKRQALLDGGDQTSIPGTNLLWAELEWACLHEQVLHLDDLLLRRSRLGLILPDGALTLLPEIRKRCQSLLSWDDGRWEQEQHRYLTIYRKAYQLPQRKEARND